MLHRLLREEGVEFWVVDEIGRYVGICRQRDLLNPPRLKIILVIIMKFSNPLVRLKKPS
jgi:manganese-dependent inorganic pyrophosphatase